MVGFSETFILYPAWNSQDFLELWVNSFASKLEHFLPLNAQIFFCPLLTSFFFSDNNYI